MLLNLTHLVFIAALLHTLAVEPAADEYRVKGAYLLNFVKFVEWPAKAFERPADGLSVCVFGANPFGPGLESAAANMVVGNRAVHVRPIAEPAQAARCQVLFVSASEKRHTRAILEATRAGNVLTVGESEGFLSSGGVINFRLDESKVRIEINAGAAERAGLHISAKLMSLAQAARK